MMQEKSSTNSKGCRAKTNITQWIRLAILLSVAIFILCKIRLCQVSGFSMFPALNHGDMCVTYLTTNVDRGDIITINRPDVDVIKRVIGLPGETVTVNKSGIIVQSIRGREKVLEEPYLYDYKPLKVRSRTYTLGSNEYWVMGDNRQRSMDSRDYGPIKKKDIIAKVICITWRKP
jgi:signal peptidase I